MVNTRSILTTFVVVGSVLASEITLQTRQSDPCANIGGQKWVDPADLRACFTSVPVDPAIKENIIDVINKTLPFHASVNYQISAPEPFTDAVHEDLLKDLARISSQSYDSDYDLHLDISKTFKNLKDGHCVWASFCYDSLFSNFLPIPLVLLTDASGTQAVHIAPEAYNVSSVEFADQIDVWEAALPKGITLKSLNGATVLSINDADPFAAVDANAEITGTFQALGTRQNSFFSSYNYLGTTWNYVMGNFAQQSLPLSDSVTLEVQRVNESTTDMITLPYRARIEPTTTPFTDTASWRAGNCLVQDESSDLTHPSSPTTTQVVKKFRQQPPAVPVSVNVKSQELINVMLDTTPLSDILLPEGLAPPRVLRPGNFRSSGFFMLDDNITGVLALGTFAGDHLGVVEGDLIDGLTSLKSSGATQLMVDLTNNGGGLICLAHWLHRIIVGPKNSSEPQAGLDTKARAGELAKLLVKTVVENHTDPHVLSLFNPRLWTNDDNVPFGPDADWMEPVVEETINGHLDAFSQRLGNECPVNGTSNVAPNEALFPSNKVVIVSNGRCASSCALFAITMAKEEGVKTVVVGGRQGVQQQYCGTVGGQSTDYATMANEVKNAGLQDHPLAPPALLVPATQGITWRLGFGIDDPTQPEEWQDHPADINLQLTAETVSNPLAIWSEVVKLVFSDTSS